MTDCSSIAAYREQKVQSDILLSRHFFVCFVESFSQLVNQIHKLKIVNNTQESATNTPNTLKKIQLVKHARKVDPHIGAISIPAPMFM